MKPTLRKERKIASGSHNLKKCAVDCKAALHAFNQRFTEDQRRHLNHPWNRNKFYNKDWDGEFS